MPPDPLPALLEFLLSAAPDAEKLARARAAIRLHIELRELRRQRRILHRMLAGYLGEKELERL